MLGRKSAGSVFFLLVGDGKLKLQITSLYVVCFCLVVVGYENVEVFLGIEGIRSRLIRFFFKVAPEALRYRWTATLPIVDMAKALLYRPHERRNP